MAALGLIMLLIWPVVVAVMFNRMPRPDAAIWGILIGYLILPPVLVIDLPAIPAIDKAMIPAIAVALFAFTSGRRDGEAPPPPWPIAITLLVVLLMISPILTGMGNQAPLIEGTSFRPGISISQSIGEVIVNFFHLLPFIIGFWLLSNNRGPVLLSRALILALLCYSIPMMMEVRLSPQINIWTYGFFQHDFVQTMRYNGFRPIVYLEHPLWVAFLTLSAVICAIMFARAQRTNKAYAIAAYLGFVLILCKSLGVLLELLVALPILWLMRPRVITMVAAILGIMVVLYPVVRASPLMPVDDVISTATGAEAERGQSLEFRLVNEGLLLNRALDRRWFGWGGWGRSMVVEPESARYLTVIDGEWIRVMGERGIVGFVAQFGLLLVPLLMLWRHWPKTRGKPGIQELSLAGLAMVLALNMVDLIPNATITPLTWLMAGIIAGAAVRMREGTFFDQQTDDVKQKASILPKKTGLNPVL